MSWSESELRTRSLEEQLEDILDQEDYSDFTEDQRHIMLNTLDIHGSGLVREMIEEWKTGA